MPYFFIAVKKYGKETAYAAKRQWMEFWLIGYTLFGGAAKSPRDDCTIVYAQARADPRKRGLPSRT